MFSYHEKNSVVTIVGEADYSFGSQLKAKIPVPKHETGIL
jgi:hypothetical protein